MTDSFDSPDEIADRQLKLQLRLAQLERIEACQNAPRDRPGIAQAQGARTQAQAQGSATRARGTRYAVRFQEF